MKIIETGFRDLILIKPTIYPDSRGYFFESFNQSVLKNEGITFNPVQDNESRSVKGVIRGLHYQLDPFAQAKLIRVVEGRILDVVLDLRKGSPTFGKWFSAELDSENKDQLLVPKGFAHGFSVLSDIAVIQYKCDNVYSPQDERGISVNDPGLEIDWKIPVTDKIISEKDSKHPSFMEAEYNFLF
jgi:dTDP-4-dehydrorhamnose 3,5-epimerase